MTTVSLPGQPLRDAMEGTTDGVDVVVWDLQGPPPQAAIDMVVLPRDITGAMLGRLADVDGLRLVQSISIGYDGVEEGLPSGLAFANASGVHEDATSELTVLLVLAQQRELPEMVREGSQGLWISRATPGLTDKRVVILGAGGVGNAIMTRLLPFGAQIDRVARTSRTDELGFVHALDDGAALLGEADVVIVVVPLTAQTQRIIDAQFLAGMKDGALLVNVARGPVADTDAILAEAVSGRLRFALDVTDPEPLPSDHPLWSTPGVLITPHVGVATDALQPRLIALLRDQAERLRDDREPRNVVLGG